MGTAKRYTPEQIVNLLRQIEGGGCQREDASGGVPGIGASPNRPVSAGARSTVTAGTKPTVRITRRRREAFMLHKQLVLAVHSAH